MVRRDGPRQYGISTLEPLEQRLLLDAVHPDMYEQYMLELINRGRADPPAEVARYSDPRWWDAGVMPDLNEGVPPEDTMSPEPKGPLAFNPLIIDAARKHSDWMLLTDTFSHYESGDPADPTYDASARMKTAGYIFDPTASWAWGENIAWWGTTGTPQVRDFVDTMAAALFGDEGVADRGHRTALMWDIVREIGVGVRVGQFTSKGTTYNTVMITEDFALSGTDVFLTGVAYDDYGGDGDNFYSPGEGEGGVTVQAVRQGDGATFSTTTWASGGYSLALPAGTYTVTASSAALGVHVFNNVVIDDVNVKVDVTTTPVLTWDGSDPGEGTDAHWYPGPVAPQGGEAAVIDSGMVTVSTDQSAWPMAAVSIAAGAAAGAASIGPAGRLTVNGEVVVGTGGSLSIDGALTVGALHVFGGSLTNSRNSAAAVTVNGPVILANGATFTADAVGAGLDRLAGNDTVILGPNASLDIVVSGGGNEFRAGTYTLIDAAALGGTFVNVTDLGAYVSAGGNGLTYDGDSGTLTLTLDKNLHPADGNLDGQTDVSDRIIWNNNNFTFGTTFATGDWNNDGRTDVSDRIIWNNNNFTFATAAPATPPTSQSDAENARPAMAGLASTQAGETARLDLPAPTDDEPMAAGPLVGMPPPSVSAPAPAATSSSHARSPHAQSSGATEAPTAPTPAQLEPSLDIDLLEPLDDEPN